MSPRGSDTIRAYLPRHGKHTLHLKTMTEWERWIARLQLHHVHSRSICHSASVAYSILSLASNLLPPPPCKWDVRWQCELGEEQMKTQSIWFPRFEFNTMPMKELFASRHLFTLSLAGVIVSSYRTSCAATSLAVISARQFGEKKEEIINMEICRPTKSQLLGKWI